MPKILFDNQLKRQNCEDFYLNKGSGLNLLHEKKGIFHTARRTESQNATTSSCRAWHGAGL